MVYTVHIDSFPVAGGVDEDLLVVAAEVAEKMKRISDAVVAGGGDPAIMDLRFCVDTDDHVSAAKKGVVAFKDIMKNAGLGGVEIASVWVGPDPCPDLRVDDTESAVEAYR